MERAEQRKIYIQDEQDDFSKLVFVYWLLFIKILTSFCSLCRQRWLWYLIQSQSLYHYVTFDLSFDYMFMISLINILLNENLLSYLYSSVMTSLKQHLADKMTLTEQIFTRKSNTFKISFFHNLFLNEIQTFHYCCARWQRQPL